MSRKSSAEREAQEEKVGLRQRGPRRESRAEREGGPNRGEGERKENKRRGGVCIRTQLTAFFALVLAATQSHLITISHHSLFTQQHISSLLFLPKFIISLSPPFSISLSSCYITVSLLLLPALSVSQTLSSLLFSSPLMSTSGEDHHQPHPPPHPSQFKFHLLHSPSHFSPLPHSLFPNFPVSSLFNSFSLFLLCP